MPLCNALATCLKYPYCCGSIMSCPMPSLVVATCHDISLMTHLSTLMHKVECPHVSAREGEVALCSLPLWPQVAHHTCQGAHVCVFTARPRVMVIPKVMVQCPFGAAHVLPRCLWHLKPPSLLQQHYAHVQNPSWCSNMPWNCTDDLFVLCIGHCTHVQRISHLLKASLLSW